MSSNGSQHVARSFLDNFQSQAAPQRPLANIGDKSFANVLTPQARDRVAQPVRKGDLLSVNIDDSLHQQGVRKLEKSLIGRMMLKQGVKPMPTDSLKASLDLAWKVNGH